MLNLLKKIYLKNMEIYMDMIQLNLFAYIKIVIVLIQIY